MGRVVVSLQRWIGVDSDRVVRITAIVWDNTVFTEHTVTAILCNRTSESKMYLYDKHVSI